MTVLPIHRVPVLTCIFIPVGSDWRRGCLRRRSGRVPEVSPEVPGGVRNFPGRFREGFRNFPGRFREGFRNFPGGSGTGAVSFRFDRFRPFLTDSDRIRHGFGRFRTVSDRFRPFQIPPETVSERFRFRWKRLQTVAVGLPTHAVWLPQVPSVPHACVIRW